ncbi:MAG TPA: glycosyltransferase family 39 protein [Myxococcales bacterium]|nr:glycosyltransferase family 39 protein [Myxococcales bacterium]
MARPQKPRSADEPPQSELQPPARDWREEPALPATGGAFGDTLPGFVREISWLRWLGPLSAERRLTLLFVVLAAVLFLPWLGATGLWDPWEVHYGEVAREMIARGDYVHPWWESAWFFSKPALDLWLMAAGMLLVRTNGPERWTGIFTEWGVRLPYAAITALGAVMIFVMANRLLSRRSAVLGTLAMLTSPLFVFLARQAVPDPVFVGLLEAAMACLMIVMFEEVPETEGGLQPRDGWAAAFYCFVGFATLSKGLLGFALPGAVAFMYCLVTGEWHRLRRLRLLAGSLIVLAICAPWYGTMFAFDGRDDEGKTFFERFIIHDHFKRLAVGVYTSTPGGDFVYFIEQIGYDVFPWVFALPGAAAVIAKVRSRPQTPRERALLFLLLWLLIGFSVFAFSVTKFHHYAFPALAPLLLFAALWLEQLLDQGLRANAGAILAGGVLYGLVAHDLALSPKHLTDMFVFNYDRPYPDRETDPRQIFTALFYAAAAVAISPWLLDRGSQLLRLLRSLGSRRLRSELREARSRRLAGAPLATPEAPQDRRVVAFALVALALSFAVFCGWFHWRRLSPHWTQRDLFWEYFHQSTPDEPIGAYQMNWRGETFYSRNTVRQIARPSAPAATLADFMAGPGARKWFLVEHTRVNALRQALGASARLRVVESRNNKFALAVAERSDDKSVPKLEQPAEKPPAPFGAPP